METTDAPTKPLLHQTSRFWFFTRGTGALTLQDQEYRIRPGTLVSVLPWQVSQIISVDEPLQHYLLTYYFDNINNVIKNLYSVTGHPINLITEMKKCPVIYCDNMQADELFQLFRNFQAEITMDLPEDNPLTTSLHSISLINKIIEIIICYLRLTVSPQRGVFPRAFPPRATTILFFFILVHLAI